MYVDDKYSNSEQSPQTAWLHCNSRNSNKSSSIARSAEESVFICKAVNVLYLKAIHYFSSITSDESGVVSEIASKIATCSLIIRFTWTDIATSSWKVSRYRTNINVRFKHQHKPNIPSPQNWCSLTVVEQGKNMQLSQRLDNVYINVYDLKKKYKCVDVSITDYYANDDANILH
ncbi:hypothetical protein FF38_09046 [Lucilia cuprina]|uniref:Uncharacterized protein n=1 Tax=Lucilia cuprina TaxID=7375 RepID=A0A0L0BQL6_LUCCU|nr:hypothetical protein FF38_09046 [Lucilia cuprina]